MEKLKFFKTRNVQSPERGTELSAGIDMYIPVDLSLNELSAIQPIKGQVEVKVNPVTGMLQEFTLMPQRRVLIPSGIKVKFPKGHCGLLVDKSGVASKVGITLLAKLIDEDYQGEIHFNLVNTSDMAVKFCPGQKITQMVVMPVSYCQPEEVSTIDELYAGEITDRGEGGFGSTNDEALKGKSLQQRNNIEITDAASTLDSPWGVKVELYNTNTAESILDESALNDTVIPQDEETTAAGKPLKMKFVKAQTEKSKTKTVKKAPKKTISKKKTKE